MDITRAYTILYASALVVIAILLAFMLIRTLRGPEITDRLLCINMIGTLVNCMILIMSALLDESWLIDVALIYTMISLVSVLILARVSVPEHPKRHPFEVAHDHDGKEDGHDA